MDLNIFSEWMAEAFTLKSSENQKVNFLIFI